MQPGSPAAAGITQGGGGPARCRLFRLLLTFCELSDLNDNKLTAGSMGVRAAPCVRAHGSARGCAAPCMALRAGVCLGACACTCAHGVARGGCTSVCLPLCKPLGVCVSFRPCPWLGARLYLRARLFSLMWVYSCLHAGVHAAPGACLHVCFPAHACVSVHLLAHRSPGRAAHLLFPFC